ncbi:hypothetical protein STEG23_016122 [Scotinomys teguina]
MAPLFAAGYIGNILKTENGSEKKYKPIGMFLLGSCCWNETRNSINMWRKDVFDLHIYQSPSLRASELLGMPYLSLRLSFDALVKSSMYDLIDLI